MENRLRDILSPLTVWAAMSVILAGALTSKPAAIVAVGFLLVLLGWAVLGAQRFGAAAICLSMFFAPASRLTVPGAGFATISDVFFVLGAGILLPGLIGKPARLPWQFLAGSVLFLAGGVISGIVGGAPTATSLNVLARMAAAMVLMPAYLAWWAPSRKTLVAIAGSYLAGVQMSMIAGLINGPDPLTGRVIGLAEQPTGHGYAAILGACLLPFLYASVPKNWRPILLVGAAGCLYTIWVSGSRASLLVGILLALAFPILERSLKAGAVLGVALVAGFVSITHDAPGANSSSALARLLGGSGSKGSTEERLNNTLNALDAYARNPWFGTGWRSDTWYAHNMYAQVGEAMGTVGLLFFLLLLVGYVMPFATAPRPYRFLVYPAVAFIVAGPITPNLSSRFVGLVVGLGVVAMASLARERAEAAEGQPVADAAKPRLNA